MVYNEMMKKIYMILASAAGLFGLIICFENVSMTAPILVLFSTINSSLFFPLFLVMMVGFVSGFFAAMALKERSDDFLDDGDFV